MLKKLRSVLSVAVLCLAASQAVTPVQAASPPRDARVLLIVWDGLRPDMINATDTPNLAALRDGGVNFTDHHSTYPTLTMINASSLATGAFPGTHGYHGNWLWLPDVKGRDSADRNVDFQQPVFTEDYSILQAIDAARGGKLLTVPTLFEVAARAGLRVAVLGKGGPTALQDRSGRTPLLDDRTALPLDHAQSLSQALLPLPRLWRNAYPAEPSLQAGPSNDPTANGRHTNMKDGVTTDPTAPDTGPYVNVNAYHMRVLNEYVLPVLQPRLAMLWLRNPDSTEHAYGPGSAAVRQALRANDALLGPMLARLDALGLRGVTNIMVVSDHAHSHISGRFDRFPLRAINEGVVGAIDSNGYSVSGEVRTADLMRRAGLLAYDGHRSQCNPIMGGIGADGLSIYLRKPIDAQFACKPGVEVTGEFMVPGRLPVREPYAVIAANGGSEYLYIPSRNREFVTKVVRFLQSRKQYGAVFIDSRRYGELPGTLPLSAVQLADAGGRNPDIIVSFNFDADASIGGVPGIEYNSSGSSGRGTHGSFSPRDIQNVLIASGPAFKADFHRDELPSANTDVAPTIAAILGLRLPAADGRVLNEALRDGKGAPALLRPELLQPKVAADALTIVEPTDPDGKAVDPALSRYTIELRTRIVRDGRREFRYYDSATAVRY